MINLLKPLRYLLKVLRKCAIHQYACACQSSTSIFQVQLIWIYIKSSYLASSYVIYQKFFSIYLRISRIRIIIALPILSQWKIIFGKTPTIVYRLFTQILSKGTSRYVVFHTHICICSASMWKQV